MTNQNFLMGSFLQDYLPLISLNRNHNIRFSLQTGFRNPTTQDLFIGLDAGRAILVGSAADNLDRYSRNFDISGTAQSLYGQPATITQTGRAAYENSYTASSVTALAATGNPGVLKVSNPDLVKPEQVTSVELGYRGKIGNVTLDMSAYYNQYSDFISGENVIAPFMVKWEIMVCLLQRLLQEIIKFTKRIPTHR